MVIKIYVLYELFNALIIIMLLPKLYFTVLYF